MTVTPIDRESMLDELKNLPITSIKWYNVKEMIVLILRLQSFTY